MGLREAFSTNLSSHMANDVLVNGLMPMGRPWHATIDEISSFFDFEHNLGGGLVQPMLLQKPMSRMG